MGTIAAAGQFAGVGGWVSYDNTNLSASLPYLDWVTVKYPLQGHTVEDTVALVQQLRQEIRDRALHTRITVWEQDTFTGQQAVDALEAVGYIAVGEGAAPYLQAKAAATSVNVTAAICVTDPPTIWPRGVVAMFEMYDGDGSPLLDNTPLASLAQAGAAAIVPCIGGFRNVPLRTWFPQFAGPVAPGIGAWTLEEESSENIAELANVPVQR